MRQKTIFLAFVLVVSILLSGCAGRVETSESSAKSSSSSVSSSSSSQAGSTVNKPTEYDSLMVQTADLKELNEHTVGWLVVPNTNINDVVLCHPADNNYYLRRNFEGEYDFDGVYYADFRSAFGDGSRAAIGKNTCIYGHAMTDVETEEHYMIKFGELHNFRDMDFAAKTPYIIFSTEKEILIWEVFAVFMGNRNSFAYNRNDLTDEEIYTVVTEEVLPRSIYDYDVEIREDDKFLTLSTCIYNLPDGTQTGYPDTHYRYGIMARLIGQDEALKETATFTENPDRLVDDDPYPN
jgi:sortase B